MVVTEPPHWHLAPASFTSREEFGVLLQDPDPIALVLHVEVIAQAVPHVGGSQASGEGARALLHLPRKARVLHLRLVYCLDDWQTTPVNCGIGPGHVVAVCCHGPRG